MFKTIVIMVTTVSIFGGKINDLSLFKTECLKITPKFSDILADLAKSYSYVRDGNNAIKEVNVKEKILAKDPKLQETIFSSVYGKAAKTKTGLNEAEQKKLINDLFEMNGDMVFSGSLNYMREESLASASLVFGVYRAMIQKCWVKIIDTTYHFRFMHSAEEIWGKGSIGQGRLKTLQEQIFKEDDELNQKWKQFEDLFKPDAEFGKTILKCDKIKSDFKEIKFPLEVGGEKICQGKDTDTLPFSKVFPTIMQAYKNWYKASFWMKLNVAHKSSLQAYLAWLQMNDQLKRDAEQQALAEKAPPGKFKPSKIYVGEEAFPPVVARIEKGLKVGLLETIKLLNGPETKEIALLDMIHRKFKIEPDWTATLTPATKFESAGATPEATDAAYKKILDEYQTALSKPDNQITKETTEKAIAFLKPFYSNLGCFFTKVYRYSQYGSFAQAECPLVVELLNFAPDKLKTVLEFGYNYCETNLNTVRTGWEKYTDKVTKKDAYRVYDDYKKIAVDYLAAIPLNKKLTGTIPDYPFNIDYQLNSIDWYAHTRPNPKQLLADKVKEEPFKTLFPDGIDGFRCQAVYEYLTKPDATAKEKEDATKKATAEIESLVKIGWDKVSAAYKNLMDYVNLKVLGPNQCSSRNFILTARGAWEMYTNRRFLEDQKAVLEEYHQAYFLPSASVDIEAAAKKAAETKTEVDHCYEQRKYVMNFKLEHPLNFIPKDPKSKKQLTFKLDELCGLYTPIDVSKLSKDEAPKKAKYEEYNKPRSLPMVHVFVKELLSKDENGKMTFGEVIHESLIDLNGLKVAGGAKPQTLNEFIQSKCCTRPPKDQEKNAGNTWMNDLKTVFKLEFNFKGMLVSKGKTTIQDADGKEKTVDAEFFHAKGEAVEDPDFPEYIGMTCTDFWTSKYTHEYFTILEHHSKDLGPYKASVTDEISIDHDADEFHGQSLLVTFPVLASGKKDPLKFQTVFRTKPAKIDDFFDYTDKTATDYGEDIIKCPTFVKEMGVYSKLSSYSFAKLFEKYNEETIKIEQKGSKKYKDIITTSTTVSDKENVEIPITVINIPISGFWSNKKTEVKSTRESALDYQTARAEFLKGKRVLQELL